MVYIHTPLTAVTVVTAVTISDTRVLRHTGVTEVTEKVALSTGAINVQSLKYSGTLEQCELDSTIES